MSLAIEDMATQQTAALALLLNYPSLARQYVEHLSGCFSGHRWDIYRLIQAAMMDDGSVNWAAVRDHAARSAHAASLLTELHQAEEFRSTPTDILRLCADALIRRTDESIRQLSLEAAADEGKAGDLERMARTVVDAERDYEEASRRIGGRALSLAEGFVDPSELTIEAISTGMPCVDMAQPNRGLERGWTVGLAAPPKMAKSAFAQYLALRMLETHPGLRVLWCLGEMTVRTLQMRALTMLSGEAEGIWRRDPESLEPLKAEARRMGLERFGRVVHRFDILPGPFTLADIGAEAARSEPDVIVVDYLQKVQRGRQEGRETPLREHVDATSQGLSLLAVERNAVVIAISSMTKIGADGRVGMATAFKESSGPGYDFDLAYAGMLPEELARSFEAGEPLPDRHLMVWRCLGHRHGNPVNIETTVDRYSLQFHGRAHVSEPADIPPF